MSWEANAWASKQRMKLPQEQLVLLVLGNCADPHGVAFAKWPGRDHWWKYLGRLTRLSRSSLFRHINTIVSLGLARRTMIIGDDGAPRPTIALALDAAFDIDTETERYLAAVQSHRRDQSHGETDGTDEAEDAENDSNHNALDDENDAPSVQSHHETDASPSPTSGNGSVPPAGLHIDSNLDSNLSPLPPSGGTLAVDDRWEDFRRAWGEPIERTALAMAAWARVPTAHRAEAIAAANGYWAFRALKRSDKQPVAAQTFLRDPAGWAQWLPHARAPGIAAAAARNEFTADSPEGRAIAMAYRIGNLAPYFHQTMLRRGVVYFRRPVTPRLLALADPELPPRDRWVVLDRSQAGAWDGFVKEIVGEALTRRRLQAGDAAPWPWPPGKDGKLYPAGTAPPDRLMTDQDATDFAQ
jgi:hypothetical protein